MRALTEQRQHFLYKVIENAWKYVDSLGTRGDYKDLVRRTPSDKICEKAFNIPNNPKIGGY